MRPFSFIGSVLSSLLDALLPPARDAAVARTLRKDELEKLLRVVTHREEPWVMALFPYHEPDIRALVRAIKYRGEQEPLPFLGALAAPEIRNFAGQFGFFESPGNALLAPIPASEKGLRRRGYNQAARIAHAIARELGDTVSYAPEVLAREERKSQVGLPREEREWNIKGAFSVRDAERVRGHCIILVDDVVESAATVKDARRALMNAGATDVIAIAISH